MTEIITKYFRDEMTAARKLILGEILSHVVNPVAKDKLSKLSRHILHQSINALDILRNKIIGEVFEETDQ